jgi:hypothetical protein
LGTECMWTSSEEFWYEGGRWRLCNIETTNSRQWKRRMDVRSWGQNNIDLITSNDEQIIER